MDNYDAPLIDFEEHDKRGKGEVKSGIQSYLQGPIGVKQMKTLVEHNLIHGIEGLLNQTIASAISSEIAFHLFPDLESGTMIIFMVGDRLLDEPKVVKLCFQHIYQSIYKAQPLYTDDVSENFVNSMEDVLERAISSMALVPISLATLPHRASHLICLCNKRTSQEMDLRTSTVQAIVQTIYETPYNENDVRMVQRILNDDRIKYDREMKVACNTTILPIMGRIFLSNIGKHEMVMRLCSAQVSSLLDAQCGTVYQVTQEGYLNPIYFGKSDDKDILQKAYNTKIGIHTQNITVCKVAKVGTSINIKRPTALTSLDRALDKKFEFTTHTMLAVPITYMGADLYGVLEISNKRCKRVFTVLDEVLAANMIRDVGYFMKKNYELYKKKIKE